jgi:hypothetical protein
VGGEIVDDIFGADHGVTETKRAMREFERNLPVVPRRQTAGGEIIFDGSGPIDEARCWIGIGGIDGWMRHPAHQVLADDVVIDRRERVAGTEEPPVGRTKIGVDACCWLAAADHVDQSVVQQREQRRQL